MSIRLLRSLLAPLFSCVKFPEFADTRIPEFFEGEMLQSRDGLETAVILETFLSEEYPGIKYTILKDGIVHENVNESSLYGWVPISSPNESSELEILSADS